MDRCVPNEKGLSRHMLWAIWGFFLCYFNVILKVTCIWTNTRKNFNRRLIDWIVFYAISTLFQPYNGGPIICMGQGWRLNSSLYLFLFRPIISVALWQLYHTLYAWELSYCKYCIYIHPINSKFSIWQNVDTHLS